MLLDVQNMLSSGGLAVLAAVVFAESGLLLGFFLPGDTLLFIAGFLASDAGGHLLPALPVTAFVVFVAAATGDQVGYLIGQRLGPTLFTRPKSRLFDPAHVRRANEFFERRGPAAIVIARFVPIVRTFVPVIAGVGSMHYRRFVTYNVIGALAWGVGVTTLGFYLGEVEFIKNNLDYAAVVLAAVSFLPILREIIHSRNRVDR